MNVEALILTIREETRFYEMALLRIYPSWVLNTDIDHTGVEPRTKVSRYLYDTLLLLFCKKSKWPK